MWINFKKTYQGPINGGCCFPEGTRIDLPVHVITQFKKEFWEKCDPVWEADSDPVVKAENAVAQALQQVEVLKLAANEIAKIVGSLTAKSSKVQDECAEAKTAAEQAVKAADVAKGKDAKDLLRKAHELIAVHNRKDLESMKAFGELQIAIANNGFANIDVAESMAQLEKLKATAKDKRSKAERAAKVTADKEARLLAEEQVKFEAEEKARLEAEAAVKAEAEEEKTRLAAEAAEKAAEAEKTKAVAETKRQLEIEGQARKELEGENDDTETTTEGSPEPADETEGNDDAGGSTGEAAKTAK